MAEQSLDKQLESLLEKLCDITSYDVAKSVFLYLFKIQKSGEDDEKKKRVIQKLQTTVDKVKCKNVAKGPLITNN